MNLSTLMYYQSIDGFLLSIHSQGYSQSTIAIYRWGLKKFADNKLVDITKSDLQHIFSRLYDSPLAPSSIENVWIASRSFWGWAAKEFGIARPDLDIPKPRVAVPEIVPFSANEIKRLLSACEYKAASVTKGRRSFRMKRSSADRDKSIIFVLLDTGIRASELCRLRVKHLDLDKSTLSVEPYGAGLKSRPRTVYFGYHSKSNLWKFLTGKNLRPENYLFTTFNHNPFNHNSLRLLLSRIGDRADILGVHPHRFRHTFAIEYLRNGGDVFTLQRLLGHASLTMVRRYLSLSSADLEAAHRKASPVDNWGL